MARRRGAGVGVGVGVGDPGRNDVLFFFMECVPPAFDSAGLARYAQDKV